MERDPHTRNGWFLVLAFYIAGGLACWWLYDVTRPRPVMGEPYHVQEAELASEN